MPLIIVTDLCSVWFLFFQIVPVFNKTIMTTTTTTTPLVIDQHPGPVTVYSLLRLENTGLVRTNPSHAYPSALHAFYIPFLANRNEQMQCIAIPSAHDMMPTFVQLDHKQFHDQTRSALTTWWTDVFNGTIRVDLPARFIKECEKETGITLAQAHGSHGYFLDQVLNALGPQRVCFQVQHDPLRTLGISPCQHDPTIYEGWNLAGIVLRDMAMRRKPLPKDLFEDWQLIQCIVSLKDLFLRQFVDLVAWEGKSVQEIAASLHIDQVDASLWRTGWMQNDLRNVVGTWYRPEHEDHDLFQNEKRYPLNLASFIMQKYIGAFLLQRDQYLSNIAFPRFLLELYPSAWVREEAQKSPSSTPTEVDLLKNIHHQLRHLAPEQSQTLFRQFINVMTKKKYTFRNPDVHAKVVQLLSPRWNEDGLKALQGFIPRYYRLGSPDQTLWTPVSSYPPLVLHQTQVARILATGFSPEAVMHAYIPRPGGSHREGNEYMTVTNSLTYLVARLLAFYENPTHPSFADAFDQITSNGTMTPQTLSLKRKILPQWLAQRKKEHLQSVLQKVVEEHSLLRRLLWTLPSLGWTDLQLVYADPVLNDNAGANYLAASRSARTKFADEYNQWSWFIKHAPPNVLQKWAFESVDLAFQTITAFAQQRKAWHAVLTAVEPVHRLSLDQAFMTLFCPNGEQCTFIPLLPLLSTTTTSASVPSANATSPLPWPSLRTDNVAKFILSGWLHDMQRVNDSQWVVDNIEARMRNQQVPLRIIFSRWIQWWQRAVQVISQIVPVDATILKGVLHSLIVGHVGDADKMRCVLSRYDVTARKLSEARDRRSKSAKVQALVLGLMPATAQTALFEALGTVWDVSKEWRLCTLVALCVLTSVQYQRRLP